MQSISQSICHARLSCLHLCDEVQWFYAFWTFRPANECPPLCSCVFCSTNQCQLFKLCFPYCSYSTSWFRSIQFYFCDFDVGLTYKLDRAWTETQTDRQTRSRALQQNCLWMVTSCCCLQQCTETFNSMVVCLRSVYVYDIFWKYVIYRIK